MLLRICSCSWLKSLNFDTRQAVAVSGLSMSKLDARCQSRVGSFARAKQSIVRAFLSTWMYIFHIAGANDKSSA